MSTARYREVDGSFEIALPEGWVVERDGEGGLMVSSEGGFGLLHLMPFEREAGEFVDPGEELYAFLEDQDIELEDDEVEDIALAGDGLLAVCEYEAEEADERVHWLIGVAAAPGQLLFASYSCPADEAAEESDQVRRILISIQFDERPEAG
jgi:hypothetical protein